LSEAGFYCPFSDSRADDSCENLEFNILKREYYAGMKRFMTIAALFLGATLPIFAQHGGFHGGFGGHSGGARVGSGFRGGFRPSAPNQSLRMTPPNRAGNSPIGTRPGYAPTPGFRPAPVVQARVGGGGDEGRDHHRPPYRSPYRSGFVYERPYGAVASYYPIYPFGLGYYGDYGYDSSYDSGSNDSNGYGNGGYDNGQGYAPDQYNGFDPQAMSEQDQGQTRVYYQPQNPSENQGPDEYPMNPDDRYQPFYGTPPPRPRVANQPAVTLIFKDHRPNQTIHNYMINGTTLTVWDGVPHEISLDDLDVEATKNANHQAGVDFILPGTSF
jgi:hypothetical protein